MKQYIVGVDIGGTTVKLGVFMDSGELVCKWEIPTRTIDNGSHILKDISESINKKIEEKNISRMNIRGIGVGVPGPVTEEGTVLKCVNLGWEIFNVKVALYELLELPIKVGNDATVATLGEMWQGGGKGYNNVVMVTLGTGVGGGVVIEGEIVFGTTGSAGEIGHMHVENAEEEQCNCGNKGCLEQYASATGMVKMAIKKLKNSNTPSILRDIPVEQLDAKTIFDAAKQKDTVAKQLVDQYNCYLGTALANVANVVDPEVIVIGGGVSKAGEIITEGTKRAFDKYAFHSCRDIEFFIAKLGNDAGIYGAAKMILS